MIPAYAPLMFRSCVTPETARSIYVRVVRGGVNVRGKDCTCSHVATSNTCDSNCKAQLAEAEMQIQRYNTQPILQVQGTGHSTKVSELCHPR